MALGAQSMETQFSKMEKALLALSKLQNVQAQKIKNHEGRLKGRELEMPKKEQAELGGPQMTRSWKAIRRGHRK